MELDDLKVLRQAANILQEIGGIFGDPNGSVAARTMADAITSAVMNYVETGPTPDSDTVAGQVFMQHYFLSNGLNDVAATLDKSYQYVRAINADLKRRHPLDEEYLREMFKGEDWRFE